MKKNLQKANSIGSCLPMRTALADMGHEEKSTESEQYWLMSAHADCFGCYGT